ncbi:hypothetical protein OEZ86_010476 [Tetradesmus obliquus]|nr:hypothetical protein OEZ86_010476 [Tetradesmus obliquus]
MQRALDLVGQQLDVLPAKSVAGTLELYAVSDLHTDYAANLEWVQQLDMTTRGNSSSSSSTSSTSRVLIVAGDVSDDIGILRATLEALTAKFTAVAFVPGNHELWVKGATEHAASLRNGGATDSIAKLHAVLQLCEDLGVITQPMQLGGLLLVPLLAWHHASFDRESDIEAIPRASAMTIADYAACKWPHDFPNAGQLGSSDTAAWFDAANESLQQPGWSLLQQALQGEPRLDTVSFSHFLPHQHLLPEKRMLSYPNLAKAVGSDFLWQRLQQLQPHMHVFGHSHFAWDMELQGIRCVQAPLCYPAERLHRLKSVILHNTLPASSSSSSGSDKNGHKQPHPLHVGLQDHYAQHVEWLPAKIYQAEYTAELRQQQHEFAAGDDRSASLQESCGSLQESGSGRPDGWQLQHGGIPLLHRSQLHSMQQQQQQQQQQSGAASFAGKHPAGCSSAAHYEIASWQPSWCSNLGGMWSEYYKVTAREPDNVQLAPWVLKRYRKYKRLSERLKGGSV